MKRTLAFICSLILALIGLSAMAEETAVTPKYVFMFIGDGMGNPQVPLPSTTRARLQIPTPNSRFPQT